MAEFVIVATNNFITRLGIVLGLFFISLIVLELTTGKPKPFGRLGFTIVYLTVIGFASRLLPPLFMIVSEQDVDLAATVWLASTAAMMTLLAYAARRRAVDASGDTSTAFFAAIPLICLVLVFKAPQDRSRLEKRSRSAFVGRTVASILAVLGVFSFVVGAQIVLEKAAQTSVPNVVDIPIERAIGIQTSLLNANLPLNVDSQTTLQSASSKGLELTLEYKVFGDAAELSPDAFQTAMTPLVQQNVCSDPTYRSFVGRGATIVFEYQTLSLSNISNIRIETSAADCVR